MGKSLISSCVNVRYLKTIIKEKLSEFEKKHYFNKFSLNENIKNILKLSEYIEKFTIYKLNYEKKPTDTKKKSNTLNEFEINDIEQNIKKDAETITEDEDEYSQLKE